MELDIRSESSRKRLFRSDALRRRAEQICAGEGIRGDVEISLLFCDDAFMASLNKEYRGVSGATDVLSFEQPDLAGPGTRVLGDIVISLETVERRYPGDRNAMRREVYLLFCHGLLHLLGYDHATPSEKKIMTAKQARYLGVPEHAAWGFAPRPGYARRTARSE